MWDTVLMQRPSISCPISTPPICHQHLHSYELGIYHKVLGDKLAQVPETSPYYARAQKYLGRLSGIAKVSPMWSRLMICSMNFARLLVALCPKRYNKVIVSERSLENGDF